MTIDLAFTFLKSSVDLEATSWERDPQVRSAREGTVSIELTVISNFKIMTRFEIKSTVIKFMKS